jgi:hypothetical protein
MASIFDYPCEACFTTDCSETFFDYMWFGASNRAMWDLWDKEPRIVIEKLAGFAELGCKRCVLVHAVLKHLDSLGQLQSFDSRSISWQHSPNQSTFRAHWREFDGYLMYAADTSKSNPYSLPYGRDMPGNTCSEPTFEKI